MGKVFKKTYETYYHDVDCRKEVLITSLVNYFGDIALAQSEELGIGMDLLRRKNMAWVLYKWDIEVIQYPVYGEKLYVETEPIAMSRFYSHRTFKVTNEKGQVFCKALSMWLMIDTEKRRLIRLPESFYNIYGVDKKDKAQKDEMEELQREDFSEDFKIRYSDIDTNLHVNNCKYIDWALEVIPLEVIKTKHLKRLKIMYKKEVAYGHCIKSSCEKKDETHYIHRIISDEGQELTTAETFWQ